MLSRLVHLSTVLVAFLILPHTASAQFESRSASPILGLPISVALADFNHDGKEDAVTAEWLSGQVAVQLGNGNGTFQPPVYYSVIGNSAYSVVAADFNKDGIIDIAVADRLGYDISILLGNGNGTFSDPIPYPTTQQPTFIAVGDFNNDGNLDLVMCDSPDVSVLLGNGDGTFDSAKDYNSTSCSQASGSVVAIGDFNADGNLDVAVVSNQLKILLGNGDGTFRQGGSYAAGEFAQSLAVADFNGDRKLDIAVTNGSGSQIYIFLGKGDGTFTSEMPFYAPLPGAIVAADVNNDRKPDLVFLSGVQPVPSNVAAVMVGNGDGTFQPTTYYQEFSEGAMIAIGDVNGDHQLDLVVADLDGSATDVLLNTGVAVFSPAIPVSFHSQLIGTTSSPQNVALANNGTKTLSIVGKKITGAFQLAGGTTCGSSVAPGAKCTLSVVFTPKVIGTTGGLLSLSDSASSKPQVIELSGVGTVISLAPTSLNFGTQKVGTKSSPQNVTVTNTGSTAVNVTSVTITGSNSKDYSQTNTCGTQIAPGASCTISVTFAPTKTGTRTAVVQINDNGGGGSQGASVTGVGD